MKPKGLAILAVFVVFAFCGIVAYNASNNGTWHVTFSGNPAPGDTVSVEGTTFTFVDGPSSGCNVSIGGTITESSNNLAEAIESNTDFEVS